MTLLLSLLSLMSPLLKKLIFYLTPVPRKPSCYGLLGRRTLVLSKIQILIEGNAHRSLSDWGSLRGRSPLDQQINSAEDYSNHRICIDGFQTRALNYAPQRVDLSTFWITEHIRMQMLVRTIGQGPPLAQFLQQWNENAEYWISSGIHGNSMLTSSHK